MKELIFDNGLVKICNEGHHDLWGNKVLKRYPIIDDKEVDLMQDKKTMT